MRYGRRAFRLGDAASLVISASGIGECIAKVTLANAEAAHYKCRTVDEREQSHDWVKR
jgi:hypothetical protein